MKNLLIILFLIPITLNAQNNEERIKEIRSMYKSVEKRLENCIKIPLTMFYDEDYVMGGSTEMDGFYDTISKEIIKIVEHTYYDWAEDETSFYYHKGELFFAYSRGNTPGEMYSADELEISEDQLWERGGEAKTLNYYEDRYYFKEDKCIRHLFKKKEISVEEEGDLSDVGNENGPIVTKDILSIHNHGLKLYREYLKQLKPVNK